MVLRELPLPLFGVLVASVIFVACDNPEGSPAPAPTPAFTAQAPPTAAVAFKRPSVAVAKMSIPTTLVIPQVIIEFTRKTTGDTEENTRERIKAESSVRIESDFLYPNILDALVTPRVIDVLERDQLERLLGELQLGEEGVTTPDQAARVGKMLGVHAFVLLSLDRIRWDHSSTPVPYTNKHETRLIGTIEVDVRVVEVESSRILSADHVEVVEEQRGIDLVPDGDQARRMWTSLRQHAAAEIAARVFDPLVPLRVIGLVGDEVELNRGASTGVEAGRHFEVLGPTETIRDPETGEAVGERRPTVARLEVVRSGTDGSWAQVLDATGEITVGSVCRPLPEPEQAPVAPRADPLADRW